MILIHSCYPIICKCDYFRFAVNIGLSAGSPPKVSLFKNMTSFHLFGR